MDQKFADQLVEDCRQQVREGKTDLLKRLVVYLADEIVRLEAQVPKGVRDHRPVVRMSDDARSALKNYPSSEFPGAA